uniref:RNA-binding protein n=1 Tax=Parastrongyloides trichosuri TaxID=131310 RepID=A0A0N4ZBG2_PARTI
MYGNNSQRKYKKIVINNFKINFIKEFNQNPSDGQVSGDNPLLNKETWGEYHLHCTGDQGNYYNNSSDNNCEGNQDHEKHDDNNYTSGLAYANDGGSVGYNDKIIGERDQNSSNQNDGEYNKSERGHSQAGGSDKSQGTVSKESLFFSGIPSNVDESYIKEVFGYGGQIAISEFNGRPRIKLYMDRGTFKGECMITYTNAMTAKEVLEKFNGSTFPGTESVLTVNYAVFKERNSSDSRGSRGNRGSGMRGSFRGGNRGGNRGGPDRGNYNRNGYNQRQTPYGNPRENQRGRGGRGSFVDRGNSHSNMNQGPMYGQYPPGDGYQSGSGATFDGSFRGGRRDGNRGGFSGDRRGGYSDRGGFRGGRGNSGPYGGGGRDSYNQGSGYQSGYNNDQGSKNGYNNRGNNRGGRGNYRGNQTQQNNRGAPGNSEIRPNDWVCPCGNNNFAFRTECNKCKAPKRNCYTGAGTQSNNFQSDVKGYISNGPRANDVNDSQYF